MSSGTRAVPEPRPTASPAAGPSVRRTPADNPRGERKTDKAEETNATAVLTNTRVQPDKGLYPWGAGAPA